MGLDRELQRLDQVRNLGRIEGHPPLRRGPHLAPPDEPRPDVQEPRAAVVVKADADLGFRTRRQSPENKRTRIARFHRGPSGSTTPLCPPRARAGVLLLASSIDPVAFPAP